MIDDVVVVVAHILLKIWVHSDGAFRATAVVCRVLSVDVVCNASIVCSACRRRGRVHVRAWRVWSRYVM